MSNSVDLLGNLGGRATNTFHKGPAFLSFIAEILLDIQKLNLYKSVIEYAQAGEATHLDSFTFLAITPVLVIIFAPNFQKNVKRIFCENVKLKYWSCEDILIF